MIANTIREWRRRLGGSKVSLAPQAKKFRPLLESLEDRECPAVFNPTDAAGLIAAITTANANNQPDVINLQAGQFYFLQSALPNITQDASNPANTLTINGNGATIQQTDGVDRVFNITDGRLFMSFVTITGGGGAGFGGGIRVSDSTGGTLDNLVLRNSLVTGNTTSAGDGGGIFFGAGGKGTIINTTISGNTAENNGAGVSILAGAGTVDMVNDTVAHNEIFNPPGPNSGSGGGINVEGGTLNISNTLVADNHLQSLTGPENDIRRSGIAIVNSRNSLYQEVPPAGTLNGLNIGNITGQNPLLGTLKNNGGFTSTQAITTAASPAVQAGDNTLITAPDNQFDQRGPGFNRIIGPSVDIGAYQFQPPAVSVGISSSLNPATMGQLVTFTATVAGTATNSNVPLGTVTFVVDNVALATVGLVNGAAQFSTSRLAVGSHTVQAVYNPTVLNDYAFAPGTSSTLNETIQPPNPLSPIGRRWRR